VDIVTPVVARFGLVDVGSLGVAAALPGNLTGGEEGSVIGCRKYGWRCDRRHIVTREQTVRSIVHML
jgi:hypothetical protein